MEDPEKVNTHKYNNNNNINININIHHETIQYINLGSGWGAQDGQGNGEVQSTRWGR